METFNILPHANRGAKTLSEGDRVPLVPRWLRPWSEVVFDPMTIVETYVYIIRDVTLEGYRTVLYTWEIYARHSFACELFNWIALPPRVQRSSFATSFSTLMNPVHYLVTIDWYYNITTRVKVLITQVKFTKSTAVIGKLFEYKYMMCFRKENEDNFRHLYKSLLANTRMCSNLMLILEIKFCPGAKYLCIYEILYILVYCSSKLKFVTYIWF